MAQILGNVVAPNGKYISNGEEKTRWLKCGILMQTENGMRIKLDCVPLHAPEGGLWLNVFEEDHSKGQQSKPAPAPSQDVGADPDIPF